MIRDDLRPARRVCLLTGATGVLGQELCRMLSPRYDVAAVYRVHPPLLPSQNTRLVDPLAPGTPVPESEFPVFAIQADLAEPAQAERVVALTVARFGGVDLLVNAAADMSLAPMTDPRRLPDWQDQLFMNVVLPALLSAQLVQHCWRHDDRVNRERNRNIVNISSVSALMERPGPGRAIYAASKAALNALTRGMAQEMSPLGLRANAVVPATFPGRVTVLAVAGAVCRLDAGQRTGGLLLVDAAGIRLL